MQGVAESMLPNSEGNRSVVLIMSMLSNGFIDEHIYQCLFIMGQ